MLRLKQTTNNVKPLLLALAMGAFLAAPLAARSDGNPERPDIGDQSPAEMRARLAELAEIYEPLEEAFELASELVRPSVVAVASERVVRQRSPFGGRNPFEEFFGQSPFSERFERFFGDEPRERRQRGIGSGLLIDEEGHILTNNHVIDGADELTIRLFDGREFDASVVGTDEHSDLAVIRIDEDELPEDLAVATFGDSDAVRLGQFVLAIGSPFGLEQTVTSGVVSSKGRSIGLHRYEDFIQTDTAINQGNSGGPLINLRGEVVGINTAILSRTGGNQGIGMAIASNMARHVAESLIDTGYVERGWLGVTIQELTPELARSFDYEDTDGTVIAEVQPDSPAEAGGLQNDDIILAIDGTPISDARDLQMRVARLSPGTDVDFTVWRDGSRHEVSVHIGEMPEELAGERRPAQPQEQPTALGLQLADLTPELRERGNIPANVDGIVITGVERGSPAAEAGLRPGHVILDVAGRQPESAAQAAELIETGAANGVRLRVLAGESVQLVVLQER